MKKQLVVGLLAGVAVGALTATYAPSIVGSAEAQQAQSQNRNSETYRQLNLFGDVFERVRADYVEKVEDKDLVENAINGMLSSLDPHSSYLNEKAYRDMQVQTRGEFGGLGIEVTMENGLVKVVSPIDDTPAAKAGIQPNDLIVQLDNDQVQGMTLQQAVEKMRGPINSPIRLTIKRVNKDPFEVTLNRATITIRSVRSRLERDDIGYVRITSFSEQTSTDLEKAITNLRNESKNRLRGLVLDLRNNPGGLLDQAVAVSDDFLEKGEIVSTRTRRSDDAQRFNAKAGDVIKGLPMVVLVNAGSASASEIVAGALQDHHRAIVVGTRSFGKGSVQTIIPLPGHGAMRLTTARYYTPSGRSIQGKGIDPDIKVEQMKLEAVSEEERRREADLPGALDVKNAPGTGGPIDVKNPPPGTVAKPTGGEVPSTTQQDYQLNHALDVLRGITLYSARGSE